MLCVISSLSCAFFFFFNDTATTEIYTLSLHDALPISGGPRVGPPVDCAPQERSQYLAALEAGGSHSRGRQERGRPWKPVRRMDDHVAGRERQRYSGRDHDSRGNPQCRLQEYRGRSEEHTSELQSPCNLVC